MRDNIKVQRSVSPLSTDGTHNVSYDLAEMGALNFHLSRLPGPVGILLTQRD